MTKRRNMLLVMAIACFFASCDGNRAADEKARLITFENMKKLDDYVVQYTLDYMEIGSPKTRSLAELLEILRANEINFAGPGIGYDGWGNELIYEPDMFLSSREYVIRSRGGGDVGEITVAHGVFKYSE